MHFDPNQYPGNEYFWYSLYIYWRSFSPSIKLLLGGYLIILLYIMVNGSKKERLFYIISFLVLLLTCLNPWMCRYLVDHWRFHGRHFRLFWLIPLPMGYAYMATKIYSALKKKARSLVYIGVAGLVVFSGYRVYEGTKHPDLYTGEEVNTGMIPMDNIYKVEDDILEISRLINEDSGNPNEEKMALFNSQVLIELRVYDASILGCPYHTKCNDLDLQTAIDSGNWVVVESLIFNGDAEGPAVEKVDAEFIKKVMSNIECQYVILPKKNPFRDAWVEAFTSLGETEKYIVLKVK
ncbi:MAG: hypothetical protein K6E10_09090 [Eubacterium sp.]|nr:hypothetical protein [Eubacterium sp.]